MAAVVVSSPGGAITADCPIYLLANEEVVTTTSLFLDWQPAPAGPGGAARVQMATFQMVKSFLARCSLSRTPADMVAHRAHHVLIIRLVDGAWSRILTELKASGAFANSLATHDALQDKIQSIPLLNPANLELVAADWRPAEVFTIPAGGGAAAAANRAALTQIRFLSLITIDKIENRSSPCPLEILTVLVGAIGSCLTQVSRRDETSSVQLVAESLRNLLGAAASDGALATRAPAQILSRRLPSQFRASGVGETQLREDLEDGVDYHRSSDGRRAVEEKLILRLERG